MFITYLVNNYFCDKFWLSNFHYDSPIRPTSTYFKNKSGQIDGMIFPTSKSGKREEELGFTRLDSFVCECDPLSQEDLDAIDATLQSSLPKPTTNNKRSIASHSPPRRTSRRRLPTSLIALQLPPSPGSTSSPSFI